LHEAVPVGFVPRFRVLPLLPFQGELVHGSDRDALEGHAQRVLVGLRDDVRARRHARAKRLRRIDDGDFDLVKKILGCIKIDLVKSSETIATLSEKKSEMPITIERLEEERLQVLIDIIKEMGGKIESEKDHFIISGKRGSVKLTFVENDKSVQDGIEIRISVSALEDPSRFTEILYMIKKRLGLLDLPLESMISQHWPIITDSDLQYVVQSAISWWTNNSILASNIIGKKDKFSKVKEWYSKIKEGKIRSNLDTITLGKIIKFSEDKQ